MKILCTGGNGYVGSALVPKLLSHNFKVKVLDTQWFGNFLPKNKNLKIINKDIRDINENDLRGIDIVIHLANIANDPAAELSPNLSWEINVLAAKKVMDLSVKAKIKQFIYASSGSVYGVKREKNILEESELVPISLYNKTKMIAERLIMSYESFFKIHVVRPATICGYSPRMRLDLTVNLLTFQAFKNKKIFVLGGNQTRPNIHIDDMVSVYLHFINKPYLRSGFYNAGFENLKILDIAKMIKNKIDCDILIKKSNDIRSYRQDSSKLNDTKFFPKYNVKDAINQLLTKFNNRELIEHPSCYTVSWMKKKKII